MQRNENFRIIDSGRSRTESELERIRRYENYKTGLSGHDVELDDYLGKISRIKKYLI
ncbi:hypothetical protein [Limisalsivibrio acetivorans]|uniref:hypothetical protein n=1 Tax=Limisalsivibrio acetivorans TaxID=1304888 RepID=UPI0003B6AC76|nr:hypothetical protein [Limisalsivibrio acetivorans]